MRRPILTSLLILSMFAVKAAEAPAQEPLLQSNTRQRFNQVFVKLFVPFTSRTPERNGPVIESWVAEELKKQGVNEHSAITDWVPICDGLLSDDVVDNRVWNGGRFKKILYCPVGGDIPRRKDGRLLVKINGWLPGGGCEANIALPDAPGTRAVKPVQILVGKERKPMKTNAPLPYVAVIVTPPPLDVTSYGDVE